MYVMLVSGPDRAVASARSDDLGVDAFAGKNTERAVPQIIRPHARQPCRFENRHQHATRQILHAERRADLRWSPAMRETTPFAIAAGGSIPSYIEAPWCHWSCSARVTLSRLHERVGS